MIKLFSLPVAKAADKIIDQTGNPVVKIDAVTDLISRVQVIVSAVAGVIAVGVVLYGAFLYFTAGGDEQKAASAKNI